MTAQQPVGVIHTHWPWMADVTEADLFSVKQTMFRSVLHRLLVCDTKVNAIARWNLGIIIVRQKVSELEHI